MLWHDDAGVNVALMLLDMILCRIPIVSNHFQVGPCVKLPRGGASWELEEPDLEAEFISPLHPSPPHPPLSQGPPSPHSLPNLPSPPPLLTSVMPPPSCPGPLGAAYVRHRVLAVPVGLPPSYGHLGLPAPRLCKKVLHHLLCGHGHPALLLIRLHVSPGARLITNAASQSCHAACLCDPTIQVNETKSQC